MPLPANLPAFGLAPGTKVLVLMWLFLELKLTGFPPTGILAFTLESSFNFKILYTAIKAGFYRAFNAIYGKVGRSGCCLLYWSVNVCQYCCMALRLVLLILQSDSYFNLPLTESYVRYSARCLVIRLLWFVFFRFKTRRRINLCATESLCYQI